MPEVPRPVPLAELVRLRVDVANALTVLREAIEAETLAADDWNGTIPRAVQEPVLRRAIGWRVFCADAFVTLYADQVHRETAAPEPEDDP